MGAQHSGGSLALLPSKAAKFKWKPELVVERYQLKLLHEISAQRHQNLPHLPYKVLKALKVQAAAP